jgi:S-adenosylmethionine-diacylglycerol 3-amino-3-carboxypropyl transferase
MQPTIELAPQAPRSFFEALLFRDVVFAMDWEDPATQDRALAIEPTDRALTITAGGCNALSLLLAGPAGLCCVDGNAAQTRLLELKLAAADTLPHDAFFDIFAARAPERIRDDYPARIRARLSAAARAFWDKHIGVVAGNLYHGGRIGLYLKIVRAYLRALGLSPDVLAEFLDSPDLATQQRWYRTHLEPRTHSRVLRRFLRSRLLNYLSGMHPEQLARIEREGGFDTATLERLTRVLTEVPIRDNYFLAMAATGAFRGDRVPPYLRADNYERLRGCLERVQPITGWLDDVLERFSTGSLDKLNLLDVFDWMTPAEVEASMHRVARVAAPNAVVLYRSAPVRLPPPDSVLRYFTWDRELSDQLWRGERSTIHGSVYVLRRRGDVC